MVLSELCSSNCFFVLSEEGRLAHLEDLFMFKLILMINALIQISRQLSVINLRCCLYKEVQMLFSDACS